MAKSGDGIDISSRMKHHRGTVQKNVAQTLKTQCEVGIIVYDDYNSRIRKEQNTIGTLTTNIGNSSNRNGQKIIEVLDEDGD